MGTGLFNNNENDKNKNSVYNCLYFSVSLQVLLLLVEGKEQCGFVL